MDWTKVIYALICLLCLAMISTVLIYNGFDKRSFRIERLCHSFRAKFSAWVEATEALAAVMPSLCDADAAELAAGYKQEKKYRRRLELAAELIRAAGRLPGALPGDEYEEQLLRREECENALAEFTELYSNLQSDYNTRLKAPVFRLVGRILKLRPFPDVLFFSSRAAR